MSLRPAQQSRADAISVDATDKTAVETWRAIVDIPEFQRHLVESVRECIADSEYGMASRALALVDVGVEDAYAAAASSLVYDTWDRKYQEALETTRRFGAAEPSIIGHLDFEDLGDGPLAVFEAAECEPAIDIRLGGEFRERDRDGRAKLADLLARLAAVCDVRVVATGLTMRFFAGEHRSELPSEFSERVRATRESGSPIAERVAAAGDALDPDGRAVALVRRLADEPGETLSRHALASQMTVSDGRVSQLLTELEDLHCIARFSNGTGKRVELTKTGSGVLDALDAEVGRQSELDAEFSGTGQTLQQRRVVADALGEGEDGPSDRPAPHRTTFVKPKSHHPTAAAAAVGGVRAIEAPVDHFDTRIREVSYNQSRREAYIAVPASTPLQCAVGTACALASSRFLNSALPDERLEAIDIDADMLRSARCIGALSDEAAADPSEFRSKLIEWGYTLGQLTTKLRHGECEDRDQLCATILQDAHGLAGSIAHLLDAAGITLVREFRVPRGLSGDQHDQLVRTLGKMMRIQSRYGHYAFYRQVFEDREEKIRFLRRPTVDATDPNGDLIGGFVLRGRDVSRLEKPLRAELRNGEEVREDAPDIAVPIRVLGDAREVYAETVQRMCREKNMDSTREAVTLLQTMTGSPWAVAEALNALGSETTARELTLDEVRYALATLEPHRLFPHAPRSVGKIATALLRSDTPLTQAALADAAGVSTRSVRRNLPYLEALTLVTETDDGYRFALPTREERHEDIRPAVLEDANAARQDLLFDVALILVDDRERFGNPRDPLLQAFGPTFDEALFLEAVPDAEPWVRPTRVLCNDPDRPETTVTVGETPSQTALQEVSA